MEDGDTKKYHVSSLIQDFVFSSRKMGFSGVIASQVYDKGNRDSIKCISYILTYFPLPRRDKSHIPQK